MTNVSAVEKMAELMQQMEENSPRVAALQYCLTQVAEKVEEAEKRNAELEARCAALSAENSGLKSAIDATIGWQQSTDPENVESVRMLVDVKTPVTDAFLAEVRASAIPDEAMERDLFEEWVMEKIFISKTTLEGLRTDDGYRNSTLSGTDYNGMWSQWKAIRAAQLRQEAAQ
ncbi:ead/Ea22-like family protein [Escherichia coli]|uniref:ead/Ea22-like family protein n=1 Tax=Escherichia coli TaxID=562 RepID=UPI00203615BB|nr:ead/Ea22-like family protein [Escherichia coli]